MVCSESSGVVSSVQEVNPGSIRRIQARGYAQAAIQLRRASSAAFPQRARSSSAPKHRKSGPASHPHGRPRRIYLDMEHVEPARQTTMRVDCASAARRCLPERVDL